MLSSIRRRPITRRQADPAATIVDLGLSASRQTGSGSTLTGHVRPAADNRESRSRSDFVGSKSGRYHARTSPLVHHIESEIKTICWNPQRESGIPLGGIRVRPETLCRITEFSEHESNGRELDEGERVAVEVLPVLGQSAAAVEPGDGAFDHPTPGLDDEALHPIGSLDDLGLEIGQDAGQGAVKDRQPDRRCRRTISRERETDRTRSPAARDRRRDPERRRRVTMPCSSKPCVSTRTCRFLPLISLPASKPWLSMRAPLFQRFSHSDCR